MPAPAPAPPGFFRRRRDCAPGGPASAVMSKNRATSSIAGAASRGAAGGIFDVLAHAEMGKSRASWKTSPMPRWCGGKADKIAAIQHDGLAICAPCSPASTARSVDLPLPDGPNSTVMPSPGASKRASSEKPPCRSPISACSRLIRGAAQRCNSAAAAKPNSASRKDSTASRRLRPRRPAAAAPHRSPAAGSGSCPEYWRQR